MDSASDLLPHIKEQVYVVPLTVHLGEEEYGVTIDHKAFYEKLVVTDVHPSHNDPKRSTTKMENQYIK